MCLAGYVYVVQAEVCMLGRLPVCCAGRGVYAG